MSTTTGRGTRLPFERAAALVIVVFSALLHGVPVTATTPIFISDTDVGSPTMIFRVNQSTGQLTSIVSITDTIGEVLGLAAASDNLLYAVAFNGDVLQITVNPPAVATLGNLGSSLRSGLEYSNGQLYVINEGTDELAIIQISPLSETTVGVVHEGSPGGPIFDINGGDLAQDADGNWYLWTNGAQALYHLDVTTAVVTPVDAGASGLGTKTGLAFDYQGGNTLFGSSRALDALLTLDTATGQTTASVNFCLNCPTVYDYRFGDAASPRCTDVDDDGFSPEGSVCGPIDCNDDDPAINPAAPERCNGIDDDCNGTTDDEPAASAACPMSGCVVSSQCVAGSCVTTPAVCNDNDPCTSDSCDTLLGCQFVARPDGFSCSDGNPCSGEEVCHGGECQPGTPLDCSDGNACTTDSCTDPNGCRNTPIPGCCTTDADCADASLCTVNERCVAGACLSDPVDCTDTNPCTSDSCNPGSGCVHAPLTGPTCSDGNFCNGLETCSSGSCTPGMAPDCDDGNACTVNGCNAQTGCTVQPSPGCCNTDADCVDASACTINERCVGHACTSDPLVCTDGNSCTSDTCAPATGCVFTPVPNGQSCADTDICNGLETCQSGTCGTGSGPDCNDNNPCTTDGCSAAVGCTHDPIPGCCSTNADCLDTDSCTVNERCVSGACISDPRDCSDNSSCTIDSCDPGPGCIHTPVLDGTSCSDGNACDGEEQCAGGMCGTSTPPNCDDLDPCTVDTCVNATGCHHAVVPGCCNSDSQCVDTDACTVNERCTAQHVCASSPRNCDDGNSCSTDTCNTASGCDHVPLLSGPCDDGNPCSTGDTCNAGTCHGSLVECSDQNLCNGQESCIAEAGTCSESSAFQLCTPGNARAVSTCTAEWFVENPNNPKGVLSRKQSCRQGDPTCDHDTDPLTCTFHVAICLRVPDPRLIPACTPHDVATYEVRKPSAKRQPETLNGLLAALDAVPGSTVGGKKGREVTFSPAVGAVHCTPETAVVIPIRKKLTLRGKATTVDGIKDSDGVSLRCLDS